MLSKNHFTHGGLQGCRSKQTSNRVFVASSGAQLVRRHGRNTPCPLAEVFVPPGLVLHRAFISTCATSARRRTRGGIPPEGRVCTNPPANREAAMFATAQGTGLRPSLHCWLPGSRGPRREILRLSRGFPPPPPPPRVWVCRQLVAESARFVTQARTGTRPLSPISGARRLAAASYRNLIHGAAVRFSRIGGRPCIDGALSFLNLAWTTSKICLHLTTIPFLTGARTHTPSTTPSSLYPTGQP